MPTRRSLNYRPFRLLSISAAIISFIAGSIASGSAPAGASQNGPSPAIGTGPLNYVSLGDSFTSGANIPPAANGPLASLCDQSLVNYPHLVAETFGWSLSDVSCSGAASPNMTQSQGTGIPPQFDALSAQDNVVSVGIGGNDGAGNGLFINTVTTCITTDILDVLNIGAPCEKKLGMAPFMQLLNDSGNIGAVFQGIHAHAPNARIFVMGYPDILPQSGNCFTSLPLTSGDVAYTNSIEMFLNLVLRTEAQLNGATFVDNYNPTIGHDLCQPPSNAWINRLIPVNPGYPLHPDTLGQRALAQDLEAAISEGN